MRSVSALVVALLAATPVAAGTLYRCVGNDGVAHYSNARVSGAQCRVAAQYGRSSATPARRSVAAAPTATPSASATAVPTAPAANTRRVEFRTGSAEAPPAAGTVPGARVSRGAVYTYVKDGVTHYTNVRPRGAGVPVRTLFTYIETCFACGALPGVDFRNVRLNTAAYAAEIRAAARQHGVDEALVRAIVHAESAFNPNAVSHKGAQGLMQLIPATATRFGVSNPFDPVQNIGGGVQYLAWLLRRFDGDARLAAAGYNAGEGNVDRYGGVPPFDETRRYVERVATLAERYRALLGTTASSAGSASAGAP